MPSGFEVMVRGGTTGAGIDAVEWAKKVEGFGVGAILPTSMDTDGKQTGYDLPMTRAIADAVSLPVIASGGAGTLEHLYEAIDRRPCRRRAGRLDRPFRHVQYSADEGVSGRAGVCRSTCEATHPGLARALPLAGLLIAP